jgi:hypothetical protein
VSAEAPERDRYQIMPALSAAQHAELLDDIQARGVLVAVEYDEDGAILDGHHRVQICSELGITDWPRLVGFQVISARDIEVMQEPLSLRLSMVQTEWLDDDGLPMSTCLVSRADEPVTLTGRGPRPSGEAKKKKAGDNQIKATIALKEWARANPDDNLITSIDIRALLKAQKLDERRRPEVLKYFVDIHVLTASVGGYTIDRQML